MKYVIEVTKNGDAVYTLGLERGELIVTEDALKALKEKYEAEAAEMNLEEGDIHEGLMYTNYALAKVQMLMEYIKKQDEAATVLKRYNDAVCGLISPFPPYERIWPEDEDETDMLPF